jgi:hypothetical protein
LGRHGKNRLPIEGLDRNMVFGQAAIGCMVGAQGEHVLKRKLRHLSTFPLVMVDFRPPDDGPEGPGALMKKKIWVKTF